MVTKEQLLHALSDLLQRYTQGALCIPASEVPMEKQAETYDGLQVFQTLDGRLLGMEEVPGVPGECLELMRFAFPTGYVEAHLSEALTRAILSEAADLEFYLRFQEPVIGLRDAAELKQHILFYANALTQIPNHWRQPELDTRLPETTAVVYISEKDRSIEDPQIYCAVATDTIYLVSNYYWH